MPRLTATITIRATYDVTNTDMSADILARSQEETIRDNVEQQVSKLLRFAKEKGTITWAVVPAKEGE